MSQQAMGKAFLSLVLGVSLTVLFGTVNRGFAELVPLTGIDKVKAGGGAFGLALTDQGTVLSWGCNANGQLGNGTLTSQLTPMRGPGLVHVKEIAPGGGHALALRSDGTVWAWGANALGQLGDGTFDTKIAPVPLSYFPPCRTVFGSQVMHIAAGLSHSLALQYNGAVWAWGSDNQGNLGRGTMNQPSNVPVPVSGLGCNSGVIAIAAGANAGYALKADGTVWAWGNNGSGQLGIGDQSSGQP